MQLKRAIPKRSKNRDIFSSELTTVVGWVLYTFDFTHSHGKKSGGVKMRVTILEDLSSQSTDPEAYYRGSAAVILRHEEEFHLCKNYIIL